MHAVRGRGERDADAARARDAGGRVAQVAAVPRLLPQHLPLPGAGCGLPALALELLLRLHAVEAALNFFVEAADVQAAKRPGQLPACMQAAMTSAGVVSVAGLVASGCPSLWGTADDEEDPCVLCAQTDGWLSDASARVYEVSTETLFLGRQDAMQRQTLVRLLRSKSHPLGHRVID